MTGSAVVDIKSAAEFDSFAKGSLVVHFWADWAEQCKQVDQIISALQQVHQKKATFARCEAESVDELAKKFQISAVPTTIIISKGVEVARVNGVDPAGLNAAVAKFTSSSSPASEPTAKTSVESETLTQQLHRLTHKSGIVLFMKGIPSEPKCRFSRATMELLTQVQSDFLSNKDFSSFNILEDEDVRQGIKDYSKWPTFPQLYINGDLVGGLDVMKEMHEEEELLEAIEAANSLNTRLKWLTAKSPVILFMKGNPNEPKCGFSRKMIALLQEACLDFDHFDIFSDEEVRQELKVFSKWPTYPQLYHKGELVGGLDVCVELHENGELSELGK